MSLTVVQNFICDDTDRLKIITDNLSKLNEVLKCPFIVNFNDTENLEVILEAYRKHISQLDFYNNLEKDWALVTLSLVEQVKTPLVMYLCEDQQFNMNREEWLNVAEEAFVKYGCDYFLLTKIGKYNNKKYTERMLKNKDNGEEFPMMEKTEFGHLYWGKFAPHKRLSLDGIYKTEFFLERLKEFIPESKRDWTRERIAGKPGAGYYHMGSNASHYGPRIPFTDIRQPNFYEGYYDFDNGMDRFKELKCYIPSKEIFIEYDDKLQKEVKNENTMDKIMKAEERIREDKIMKSLEGVPLPKYK